MKKFLALVALIVFSSAISLAQEGATNGDEARIPQSGVAQEIEGLKAEIAKLNALVLMLQEKNKLTAEVEALKKQIEKLQSGPTSSKPASPIIASSIQSAPTPLASGSIPTSNITATQNSGQQSVDGQKDTCLNMRLTPESYSNFEKTLCDLAKKLVRRKFRDLPDLPAEINFAQDRANLQTIMVATVLPKQKDNPTTLEQEKVEALRKFILEAENARTDKQIGSDSKAAGSTSLVVKGGMPRFLSWGMENGSVEGSRNGNTLTFRVNPFGLLKTLTQPNYINSLMGINGLTISQPETSDAFNKFLNNLSVGFSFDMTRGTDRPIFIGSKQQLSAVSTRYQFLNRRDPTDSIYREEWEKFADNTGSTYLGIIASNWNKMLKKEPDKPDVFANAKIQEWLANANKEVKEKSKVTPNTETDEKAVDEMYNILTVEAGKLSADILRKDAVIQEVLTAIGEASLTYAQEKRKLLDKIKKGDVISAEYTNYREANAPDMSNFRFIAQKHIAGSWSMDFNSSITFFNKKPASISIQRLRDFDFALQFETPLRDLGFGKPTFAFAGKYQRLKSDAFASDGLAKAQTKGDIAFGQLKLEFPIGGTGLKIPFSLSFANRSELIKEKRVFGANFGLTFDFDQLFLKKMPF